MFSIDVTQGHEILHCKTQFFENTQHADEFLGCLSCRRASVSAHEKSRIASASDVGFILATSKEPSPINNSGAGRLLFSSLTHNTQKHTIQHENTHGAYSEQPLKSKIFLSAMVVFGALQ